VIDDQDRYEWVNASSGIGSPGLSQTKGLAAAAAAVRMHLSCTIFDLQGVVCQKSPI